MLKNFAEVQSVISTANSEISEQMKPIELFNISVAPQCSTTNSRVQKLLRTATSPSRSAPFSAPILRDTMKRQLAYLPPHIRLSFIPGQSPQLHNFAESSGDSGAFLADTAA
jgi:hypothetical protein